MLVPLNQAEPPAAPVYEAARKAIALLECGSLGEVQVAALLSLGTRSSAALTHARDKPLRLAGCLGDPRQLHLLVRSTVTACPPVVIGPCDGVCCAKTTHLNAVVW